MRSVRCWAAGLDSCRLQNAKASNCEKRQSGFPGPDAEYKLAKGFLLASRRVMNMEGPRLHDE
eukprot:2000117-Amphidinium_carterae.2